jgi:hypothetical protein
MQKGKEKKEAFCQNAQKRVHTSDDSKVDAYFNDSKMELCFETSNGPFCGPTIYLSSK